MAPCCEVLGWLLLCCTCRRGTPALAAGALLRSGSVLHVWSEGVIVFALCTCVCCDVLCTSWLLHSLIACQLKELSLPVCYVAQLA